MMGNGIKGEVVGITVLNTENVAGGSKPSFQNVGG